MIIGGELSYFLFFKQKTAYEMRISDWSSDVCSSDLFAVRLERHEHCVIAGLAVWRQITFDPGGECRLLRGLRGEVGADLLDWAIRGLREEAAHVIDVFWQQLQRAGFVAAENALVFGFHRVAEFFQAPVLHDDLEDRKSTRLNYSH